jgi:hypothetical protein
VRVTMTIALPVAALVVGYGLRGVLNAPLAADAPGNCLDLIDAPIAVLFDNKLVRATAHPLGPGWVIIPVRPAR